MSTHLNMHITDRAAFPFAVGVQTEDAPPVYIHFQTASAAEFFAGCCGSPSNKVTRWVAVLDKWIVSSTLLGWREVTAFSDPPRGEDRAQMMVEQREGL